MQSRQDQANSQLLAKQRLFSPKSVSITRYQRMDEFTGYSAHTVLRVKKRKSKYFLKLTNGRKISEIEALSAAYYRLFMGPDRAPQVRSVYKDNDRIGVVSKKIPGFRPAYSVLSSFSNNNTLLVQAGIAKLLVASYVLEECDLHKDNWGFNKDGNVVRIDFDRSFWPVTYKYLFNNNEYVFRITERDILNFPILQDTYVSHWFKSINRSPTFINDKWKYFLKLILLHNTLAIREIANLYLGSASAQDKYYHHLNERLANLKSILIQLPQFQDYLAGNLDVLSEIQREFLDYNASLKEKDKVISVDVQEIEKSFSSLIDAVNDMTAYKNRIAHERAKNELKQRISMLPKDSPIKYQAEMVLRSVEETDDWSDCGEVETLTTVLEKTSDLLQVTNISGQDGIIKLSHYTALSDRVSGKPSLRWQILGAAMAVFGAFVCTVCVILAATTLIPSFGLGVAASISLATVGASLAVAGVGMFAYHRRQGLSAEMHEFTNRLIS